MDRWLGHLGFLVKLSLQRRMANGEELQTNRAFFLFS
jgi:hypothetical protein